MPLNFSTSLSFFFRCWNQFLTVLFTSMPTVFIIISSKSVDSFAEKKAKFIWVSKFQRSTSLTRAASKTKHQIEWRQEVKMGNDGKVSNTETINQNICTGKLISQYCKQFETLLMKQIDENNLVPTAAKQFNNSQQRSNTNNNFSQSPRMTKSQPIAANRS